MDLQVRPQDDLFGFVNGQWVRTTEIPSDRGRYGTFDVLRDAAEKQLNDILGEAAALVRDEAAASSGSDADSELTAVRRQVGALYASFLDEDRIESLGILPLTETLAAIDAVTSTTELWELLGQLTRQGLRGAISPYVNTDDRNPEAYIVYLEQGGLGLPDESYYQDDAHEAVRESYAAHIQRMLALAGRPFPATEAAVVMGLETRLARSHWDRVTNRDPVKTYTKMTTAELRELAPALPVDAWRSGMRGPQTGLDEVIVRQPSYLTGLSEALDEEPLESWQSWLRWHLLRSFAPLLSSAFVEENFDFFGRTLTGAPELAERWKRATQLVNALLGEALGRLYVARHFPPAAKEHMLTLVGNIIEAYRRDIADLDWMGEDTKARALEKLDLFNPKIGYPDTWRDYSSVRLDPADLVGNVRRANAFETDREWSKLGGPVDRGEWFMPPQAINAYYNPGMNEIVFPAAILQPPFFDPDADDAVNYGAIGSVIGHEIGHGFDDQGSQFDGNGRLEQWWTEADRARFDGLTARLVTQFDGYVPRDLPDGRVNGALTVGENIGDLGGVTVAHLAYRISQNGARSPVLDGLTGDQRFFAGWAQIWRSKSRPEDARRMLTIDPHSPGEFRANIVRNLTEFHQAFNVQPGDDLWLDPEDRVRIW